MAPNSAPPYLEPVSGAASHGLALQPSDRPRSVATPDREPSSARSAPATLSTPFNKRKSAGVDEEQRHSPKRRSTARSAGVVAERMAWELHGSTFRSAGFFRDFIYPGGGGPDAAGLLRALCQASPPLKGLTYDEGTPLYWCDPDDFSDPVFPAWFCALGNAVAALSTPAGTAQTPTWIVTRKTNLPGGQNNDRRRRPDFALFFSSSLTVSSSSSAQDIDWHHVLIVGEHQSKGSTRKASFAQLSCYAEQVFVAQPFRSAVLGIWTSNTTPRFEVWRFDRAGALGSFETGYMAGEGLRTLVLTLSAMTGTLPLDLERCGFQTAGIDWAEGAFPIDERSIVSARLPPEMNRTLHYKKLVCCAKGIVSRGTRVWTGVLRDPSSVGAGEDGEVEVAIKESWRSAGRESEASLYGVAAARGVQGLPALIHHASYADVRNGVRLGHMPTPRPYALTDKLAEEYTTHIAAHNRIFSRLILNKVGVSIEEPSLTPLAIARGLLAGLIGHASLFFQGNILHRDISPYNILSFPTGVFTLLAQVPKSLGLPDLYGRQTQLHGCLIDLDYALDMSKPGAASGAKDRTGTYPFIAIALLKGGVSHRYRHDLESLLYVLLCVALYPRPKKAPGEQADQPAGADADEYKEEPDKKRELWDPRDPLKVWFAGDEVSVATHKESGVVNSRANFNELLEQFREGFGPFRDAARRIRMALWGVGANGTGTCELLREGPPGREEVGGKGGKTDKAGRARTARGDATGKGVRNKRKQGKAGRAAKTNSEGPRGWLHPDEVRVGVSNGQAYQEIREVLEDLVDVLENPESEYASSDAETDGDAEFEDEYAA